jgi:CHAT domain/NACHT domain
VYAEYRDFYLHVGWPDERNRFPIHVVQSPCGETRQPVWQENNLRLPACQHVLDYLQELIAEPEEVELLGRSLHEFLFPPEVDEIFHRCREDKESGLRIRLRVDPEELSLLPWEYCFDPRTRQYLALERQTPFVRYIAEGFAAPSTLTMPRPVKLLVVLAAPRDQPALDMQREEDGIRQALQNVPVELALLRHATIEKLHDALLDVEPHILHFSGHGVLSNGFGALALEKPGSGDTDPLTARQLRGLLNRMGITLAVLNACETARHSTRDALMGVAQALIREEIPAVIAMQFLVSETVALMFTRRLYDFLFRGDPLEKIVTETRVGIDINSEEDRISWGIPVLFMRARDGYLWKPQAVRSGSGLESLVTADLKSRPSVMRVQPATTENIFLNKVYRQWIVDVLSRSIPNAERRIDFIFQQEPHGVALAGKSLSTLFDEMDSSLLLLGAPGAGKTIALCELARDLIQRASTDDAAPLPVILRLAPWRASLQQDLKTWLQSQLQSQYGLGRTHIEEIKRRGLILLLDGLDEVCSEHRASCVKAINEHCAQEGWVNVVVTCRAGEYADLSKAGVELTIPRRQVVGLAPLEAARIDRFLAQLDRVGIDVSHLHSLLENECTPLMTDVILQTYVGKPPDAMDAVQVADVWDNYVARKFEDERARQESAGKAAPYPPAMTRKWLNWVALQLRAQTQDQHRFFVEELQPGWLSQGWMILSYGVTFFVLLAAAYLLTRFTFKAGLLILYGEEGVRNYLADYLRISIPLGAVWIVCISWVFARRSRSYAAPVVMGLLSGIVFGSMIWVPYRDMPALAAVGGAITAIIAMALVRIVIQVLGFSEHDIVCVKRRKWDWTKAGRGLVIGVVFVLLISLVSDTARAMFYQGMGFGPALQRAFSFDTVVWWNWGLPGLLSMSLFFLLVFGLGWGTVVLRDEVDMPNQGIIDSGRNGITVAAGAVLAGLIFSLAIGLPCYLGMGFKMSSGICAYGDPSALWSGLAFGLGYGAILGLGFGLILGGLAWLRHYLLRLLLFLDRRQIPWRLERFLAYAARVRLLRRVGGGFEFIDQELQAYFERADNRG